MLRAPSKGAPIASRGDVEGGRTGRIVLGEPHVDGVRLAQHVVRGAHDLLVDACAQIIGCKVDLRGELMFQFLEILIIILPGVRNFRGISFEFFVSQRAMSSMCGAPTHRHSVAACWVRERAEAAGQTRHDQRRVLDGVECTLCRRSDTFVVAWLRARMTDAVMRRPALTGEEHGEVVLGARLQAVQRQDGVEVDALPGRHELVQLPVAVARDVRQRRRHQRLLNIDSSCYAQVMHVHISAALAKVAGA